MATIKIRFRPSSVKDKDGTLYYQIIHMRLVKQLYTDYRLQDDEWDSESSTVIISDGCDRLRAGYLSTVRDEIRDGLARLKAIVNRFESSGKTYTVEDVASAFISPTTVTGVVSFMRKLIDDLRKMGKKSMAKRFSLTLNCLLKFTGDKEVAWEDFNSTFVTGFEEFLRKRGLCRNSTSFYMRNLRSIINRASEHDYEVPRNPFKHVYMGVDKTVKRAVTLKTVCKIRDVNLSAYPHLDSARNVFMFSFYTRGMSFVDIAFLRKSDLTNGVITYFRRKTSQQIQVRVENQTRDIMDKLGENSTLYLLPIIGSETIDADSQYRNVYHRVNRNLRKLGEMLKLETKLTLYVARHAWASIAHHNNIPISTISKAMGHDSETTTLIYLSSIDSSVVDKANRRIMSLMKE